MALCYKINTIFKTPCYKYFNNKIKTSLGDIPLIKGRTSNNTISNTGYCKNYNLISTKYFDDYQNNIFNIKKGKIKKITTWNIQELWWFCYNNKKINNIIQYLENCDSDVICLQEVFEEKSLWKIVNSSKIIEKYPYYLTGNMCKRFIIGENSGLLVLSKYPILFKQFTPFNKSKCPDFYASKGALYFTICDFNFITTHLQSSCPDLAYKQLDYIVQNSPFSLSENTILLGDLNVENPFVPLDVRCNNIIRTHDSNMILDHIIPLKSCRRGNINVDVSVDVSVDDIDLTNISDHYPVHAVLS